MDDLKFLRDSRTLSRFGDTAPEGIRGHPKSIETAMGFEKDTILFFVKMHEFSPDREEKYIKQCIDEDAATYSCWPAC